MSVYLFDFDGTLVDSMPKYASAMVSILDETDTPYPDDIIKTITPLGVKGTALFYLELGVPLSYDEIITRMGEKLIREYLYNIEAKESVCETLRALRSRGDSLNILTASPHETLDPCLRRIGIFDLFDNVWSCSDFEYNKSQTRLYETVSEKLSTPISSVIFLDDNPNACRTAKTAGMVVYGVYDDTSAESESEMRDFCDGYIRYFSELV
jgi:HAD superfamily hydrolase (TIGR01509 family)